MALKPKPSGFIRTKSPSVHPEKGKKFQHPEFHAGHKAINGPSQKSEGKKFKGIAKRSQTEANRPEVLSSYAGSSGSMTNSNEKYGHKS